MLVLLLARDRDQPAVYTGWHGRLAGPPARLILGRCQFYASLNPEFISLGYSCLT